MDAHKADKKLWTIERQNYRCESIGCQSDEEEKDSRRITEKALAAAEAVQKQYSEYQKFYTKEVTRLNSKIRELSSDMQTKDTEHRRRVAALSEQIKILEIDQRNLNQAKEMQISAREVLQAGKDLKIDYFTYKYSSRPRKINANCPTSRNSKAYAEIQSHSYNRQSMVSTRLLSSKPI